MHLKTTLAFILFFLSNYLGYSQKTFDQIYTETYQVLLSSNPKKALSNTDYLFGIAKNNSDKIKTRMLKAHILYQYGLNNQAIIALKEAENFALAEKDFVVQSKIYGFLASLYRESEIFHAGKTYLNKAVLISRRIKDKSEMYRFQGNLSQELACYELLDSNYVKAIKHLKKGIQLFEKAEGTSDKNYQIAINDELIARNYLELKKSDSALFHYEKAEKELQTSLSYDSPLKGFIYNGIANVYTSLKDYKKAQFNYIKAEKIAEESDYSALKQEVYTSLMEFYKVTNSKKYIIYNEKNLKLSKAENDNKKVIADDLIKTLRQEHQDSQSQYEKNRIVIISICVLAIIFTVAIYFFKRKQDYKKIREFINAKPPQNTDTEVNTDIERKKEITKEYMSEATENSILESIIEFEKSFSFLNKTLSLNSVAAELNVNHRYLSYVINKHKSKDFASYINELRINYIIDRLKNDESYLKYKISYLADQAGFASHSRFTITFKKITGVSPLTFITYVQNNPEKNS
ncbi:AraC-like DNA-binding protein [Flavobacterium nitrogenifigens]|uniref:AraC-like DNA-binding protein n=2 Tax=Flavobacterium TaxID=237 RepID=A0A7W7N7D3_9FLAO|nr:MULTISPECIES: AraC family transcriptional regulator [Flavobacterium]MBB4802638.1 AraC-like DNA-binding protein [Flavobacterium nitrogenifigens]MBB6387596.1 AraC-like DNA-binding protein [Flavobacterium notoginsengisoli]